LNLDRGMFYSSEYLFECFDVLVNKYFENNNGGFIL
jgi:hypothetical protein